MSLAAVHQVQHTISPAVPTTAPESTTAATAAKAGASVDATPVTLTQPTVRTMFALPRVNLKISSNSTTLSNCADDVQHRYAGTQQQSHTRPSSQLHPEPATSFELSGGDKSTVVAAIPAQSQLSSLQHYSTEKSGSSGYYSSHVYSTSSFDDHIYSEPVGGSVLVVSRGACGTGTTEAVVAVHDSVSQLSAQPLYGVPSASALSSVSVAKKLAQKSVNVSASQALAAAADKQPCGKMPRENGERRMQAVGIMPAIQRQQHPLNHPSAHHLYHDHQLHQHQQMAHYHYQQYQQHHPHHQSAGLVNLESSIKNLELHLKAFSRPPSVQNAPYTDAHFDDDDSGSGSIDHRYEKRKSVRLPTIMEGIDGQPAQSQQITQNAAVTANGPTAHVVWQDIDPDDSLMDLDLDSFMMANELAKKSATPNQQQPQPTSFVSDSAEGPVVVPSDLTYDNKSIENNYKCRKYINSCPDDPYNIEETCPGTTDSQQPQHPPPTFDKSTLSSYLHQCNDRLHYQSTRHILEEIRVKLTALLKPNNVASSSDGAEKQSNETLSTSQAATVSTGDATQLQHSIQSLKGDLDNYLGIMNASNEMEIRQLCNGLSKDHKLVRIQNALGNRDSTRRIQCPDRACSNYVAPSPTSSPAANNATEPNAQIASNSMATTATATATATTASLSSYTEREETQFDTVYVRDGFSFGYKSKIPFRLDFSKTQPATRAPNNSAASHYDASHVHPIASQRVHPTFATDATHGTKYKCSPCSSCEEMMQNTESSQDDEGATNSGEEYTPSTSDDVVRYRQSIADLACSKQHQSAHTLGPSVMLRYPAQVYDSRGLIRPDELKAPVGSFYQPAQQQQLQHAADYHQNKPSIWEQYYGTNRMNHTFFKIIKGHHHSIMSYPSERPESDFTLDLPQAEQLRLKMKREKQFRHRCRIVTSFLSLVFFLLTVVVVSLLLTRGKHPFGSMI